MAANNFYGYGGAQYAATNAAYPQTQQYAMPSATGASTAAASYPSQRSAYDAGAYQTSANPVTYATQGVGVTYDSSKTFYQQAAPGSNAVAATTTQGAASIASSAEYQNWQHANFNARQSNAVALAAAQAANANKATYGPSYTGVPTTRQLTVPPIAAKGQANSNSSPYNTQYTNQPTSTSTNYHYSSTATTNKAGVGTIGQPKKPATPYQQKSGMAGNSNITPPGTVASNYGAGNAVNSGITATAYAHVSALPYSSAPNSMYTNATPTTRPKGNQTAVGATNSSAAYSNPYDAALFNAAASMFMNQNPRGGSKAGGNYKPRPGLGSNPKLRNFRPPKPQQLHYCDACKISCAGPSAYHDHLQGQKHKKKVAKAKPEPVKGKPPASGNLPVFICELCDIECTAADAYAAHLRGAKHTKVVKLHTRLGKPIPPPDPKASAAIAALNAQEEKAKTSNGTLAGSVTISAAPTVKAPTTPRITFVAAGNSAAASTSTASAPVIKPDEKLDDSADDDKKDNDLLIDDRPAVGSEYIEEEKDATGKLISFNCKLCECKFSDPNAKEMHMKGRKHRLQFKKKVDPKLKVEMKPNNFKNKRNEKWKKQTEKPKEIRKKDFRYDEEMKDYMDWCRKPGPSVNLPGVMPQGMRLPLMRSTPRPLMMGPGLSRLSASPQSAQPPMFMLGPSPLQQRKPDSFEDRYVLSRHKSIYPSDVELQNIHLAVGHIEKALKLVSDFMLNEIEEKMNKEEGIETPAPVEPTENENENENENEDSTADDSRMSKEDIRGSLRELTGVLRVGIIAKCLILSGDDTIELVMLCSKKPTLTLLTKVVSLLPEQLKEVCKCAEYTVTAKPADAAIVITTRPTEEEEATTLTVIVTLTSTVIREEIMAVSEKISKDENGDEVASGDGSKIPKEISPDPPDVLSKTKCLEALAALRHAKWFQARAATIPSCLIIIRVLRDLCKRVPVWIPFNSWAMELLCEKVLSSTSMGLSPGDGLRRVFECISSGILLPHGPGLLDPCEKDPVDAAAYLTPQQREEITASAQVALRLIAFRQIHKVLGMEPLPPLPKFRSKQPNRKRRRENSAGGRNEEVDGKKDKKEDGDQEGKGNENEFGEERMETAEPATK